MFGAVSAGLADIFLDPRFDGRPVAPGAGAAREQPGCPAGKGAGRTSRLHATREISRGFGNGTHPRGVEMGPHVGLQPDRAT